MSLAGAGTDSGTFDYFTDAINGEEGASRSDYAATEDDNVTVRAVQGDKGALGYFGFSYYEENQDTLKALEVDGGEGCVAPSAETAQDGSYTPALPAALRLREERVAREAGSARVPALLLREPDDDYGASTVHLDARRAGSGDRTTTSRPRSSRRAPNLGDAATPLVRPQPVIRLRAERRRYGEDLVKVLLGLCAAVSVATTIGIIVALLQPALEFFREVNFIDYITGTDWAPLFTPQSFGVLPLVVGTLTVTFWACVVCMPFGLGSAIYLSEYASERVRKLAEAGARDPGRDPHGGLRLLRAHVLHAAPEGHRNRRRHLQRPRGGPRDGRHAHPDRGLDLRGRDVGCAQDLRAGAYALGATRLHVSTRIVVPAAFSGIIASYVLAISRAIGETMIVLIAAGTIAQLTFDPRETSETMTAFIGATGIGDVPTGSIEYKTIFAVGLTLFAFTLVMNLIAIRLVRKWREVYE